MQLRGRSGGGAGNSLVNILVPAPGSTVKFYYEGGGTPVAVTRSHGQQWSYMERRYFIVWLYVCMTLYVYVDIQLSYVTICYDVKYVDNANY